MAGSLSPGVRVSVHVPDDSPLYTTRWWPKAGRPVTGTVQRVFKNGNVAVAVDQIRNFSADRVHTMHLPAAYLEVTA